MRKVVLWSVIAIVMVMVLPYSLTRFGAVSSRLGHFVAQKISEESGLDVEIGHLRLTLPFYLVVKELSVARDGEVIASSDKLRIAWSPLRLLQGQFSFPIVESRHIALYLSEGESVAPPIPAQWPCSPVRLHVGNVRVDQLEVIKEEKTTSYSLSRGEFTIHPKCGDFGGSVVIQELEEGPRWEVALDGNSDTGEVTLAAGGSDLSFDLPLFASRIEASLVGTLEEWHALTADADCTATPLLQGVIDADLTADPYAAVLYNMLGRGGRAEGAFFIDSCLSLHLVDLTLIGDDVRLSLSGEITRSGAVRGGRFAGELFELSALLHDPILSVKGPLQIDGELFGPLADPFVRLHFSSDLLLVDRVPLYTPRGEIEWNQSHGSASIEGYSGRSPIRLQTTFSTAPDSCLSFPSLTVRGEGIALGGSLYLCKDRDQSSGRLRGRIDSLAPWSTTFNADLEGGASISATLSPREEGRPQELSVDLTTRCIVYNQMEIQCLELDLQLFNPLRGIPSGLITANLSGFSWGQFQFQRARAQLRPGPGGVAFEVDARGPSSFLSSRGQLSSGGLEVDELTATFDGEQVRLEQPMLALYRPSQLLEITPVHLQLGEGRAELAADLTPDGGGIEITAEQLPLSWIARLSLGPQLRGSVTGHLTLKSDGKQSGGSAVVEWDGIALDRTGGAPITGWAQARLQGGQATFGSHSDAAGSDPIDVTLEFPLDLSLMPLSFSIPPEGKIGGNIQYDGKIGPLTRTFLFRRALVEGNIDIDLALDDGELSGGLSIRDGSYTNLRMGTQLQQIEVDAVARDDRLELTRLSATDGCGGRLSGRGELIAQIDPLLPFKLEIELDRMALLQMEDLRSRFSGPLLFSGSVREPALSGQIVVPGAQLKIPERMVSSPTTLPVTYINVPQQVQAEEQRGSRSSPCALDLKIDILPAVTLNGRGLESVWRGTLDIGGTTEIPDAKGQLELVRGSFRFSDHLFNLVQGRMGFDGPLEVTTLELVGTLRACGIDVIATLAGPVDDPKLSLRSVPPLPLREVLSLVLFDAPIDEITPFQALQLAAATAELSGGQMLPNPLRTIRSKLGLDRLCITRPDQTTDEIGIEAGRHIGRHAYLTLYRSLQTQYSHMLIELDLFEQWQLYSELQDIEGETFGVRWKKDY